MNLRWFGLSAISLKMPYARLVELEPVERDREVVLRELLVALVVAGLALVDAVERQRGVAPLLAVEEALGLRGLLGHLPGLRRRRVVDDASRACRRCRRRGRLVGASNRPAPAARCFGRLLLRCASADVAVSTTALASAMIPSPRVSTLRMSCAPHLSRWWQCLRVHEHDARCRLASAPAPPRRGGDWRRISLSARIEKTSTMFARYSRRAAVMVRKRDSAFVKVKSRAKRRMETVEGGRAAPRRVWRDASAYSGLGSDLAPSRVPRRIGDSRAMKERQVTVRESS